MIRRLLLIALCMYNHPAWAEDQRWAVYYSDKLAAEKFLDYDVIVFDSDHHPEIGTLIDAGKTVLGYISLGEAEQYRPDFDELKRSGMLLDENEHWPGHFVIDVRNPKWVKRVIEEEIPRILHKRFSGIMIDTMDSTLYLEDAFPKKYPGMKDATIRLLQAIRMHYPQIKIMLNRGFDAMPDAASSIDMIMAENIYTDHDFKKNTDHIVSKEDFQYYLDALEAIRKANPAIKVYGVEYWNLKDTKGVQSIYAELRKHNIAPYVSDVKLDTLHPEP